MPPERKAWTLLSIFLLAPYRGRICYSLLVPETVWVGLPSLGSWANKKEGLCGPKSLDPESFRELCSILSVTQF